MQTFLTSLLEHYHITYEDLRQRSCPGSFMRLRTPFSDPMFQKTILRLKEAVRTKEKTVIYGDYDVDGLTSTAILKKTLDSLGLNCGYFIPSRYREGYGLVKERVEDFHKKGYSLLVTVDNGIVAFDAVELAKSYGMDVIVIDHHEFASKTVDTPYIFHQKISHFIDYNCSAASLCLFVSYALLGHYEEYLATLAGLAVFSDVMPLVGNNLELAKLSLSLLKKNSYPNLLSLIQDHGDELTYEDLSFKIISALNSIGRVESDVMATNRACQFLIENANPVLISKYSGYILSVNRKKKELVKNASIEEKSLLESSHSFSGIISSLSGLSGLVSNRILREKGKCCCIFAPDEKDESLLVGSIRAMEGYDLLGFLEKNRKLFVNAGGHPRAIGLTIKMADYYQVALLFSTEVEGQALELKGNEGDQPISIALEDLNRSNYDIYRMFLPFGEGFRLPTFEISVDPENVIVADSNKASFVYSSDHSSKITYFGVPDLTKSDSSYLTFSGEFKKEIFRGKVSYVLLSDKVY